MLFTYPTFTHSITRTLAVRHIISATHPVTPVTIKRINTIHDHKTPLTHKKPRDALPIMTRVTAHTFIKITHPNF